MSFAETVSVSISIEGTTSQEITPHPLFLSPSCVPPNLPKLKQSHDVHQVQVPSFFVNYTLQGRISHKLHEAHTFLKSDSRSVAFYENQRFVTVYTKYRHVSLSRVR